MSTLDLMADNRLGEFLRARREQVPAASYDLPDLGRRRTPGLRREELAILSGISVEYYVRLERGRDRNPSPQVLDALARVLRLDDDAAAHLRELADPARRGIVEPVGTVHPRIEALMAGWHEYPAFVLGGFMDVLAFNPLAELLHVEMAGERNVVRQVFLDPSTREFYPDWDEVAAEAVATLRAIAGRHLDHPRLVALVGELSLRSPEFARLWARHEVRAKTDGRKRIRHPQIGELEVQWETFGIASAPGQMLVVYQAEPGTRSAEALTLLARLADTGVSR